MKRAPYKMTIWAIMRDGEPYMAVPDLDMAEAYYSSLSLNGHSKHRWEIKKAEIRFSHETARERRERLNRHVQAVVEINRALARS